MIRVALEEQYPEKEIDFYESPVKEQWRQSALQPEPSVESEHTAPSSSPPLYRMIVKTEIEPLINEYWNDNSERAKKLIEGLKEPL